MATSGNWSGRRESQKGDNRITKQSGLGELGPIGWENRFHGICLGLKIFM